MTISLVRAREVVQRIERLGGWQVRQRGSHRMFQASAELEDGSKVTVRTVVPQHGGDLPIGTLRAIERDMAPLFGKGWLG
ncbi:type II toxin-antitoxin system HicA family toxin [Micromonospora sp. NPDC048898]|uniref:type II toxin-antitoxin system HicA family toxin n=1 Tax=Micromonospora sp. NPDC048898 TaxID=3364260 RepID=UPI0037114F98